MKYKCNCLLAESHIKINQSLNNEKFSTYRNQNNLLVENDLLLGEQ